MTIKLKIILSVLAFSGAISLYFYIQNLQQRVENKDIIIQKMQEDQDKLLNTIRSNEKVFIDYKKETETSIKSLQELIKKDNLEEQKSEEKIKEVVSIDYKKTEVKVIKEKVNQQFNNIIGELNEME